MSIGILYLFDQLKTVGDSAIVHHQPSDAGIRVLQATSQSNGKVQATIHVEGSNVQDSAAWVDIGQIQLYGVSPLSNFKDSVIPCLYTKVTLVENVYGQIINCNIAA
jgi:hypothetical protein